MNIKGLLSFVFTEKFGWAAVICLIIGGGVGVALTVGSVVAIEQTSTNEFCGTCHSHKPIIASFKADKHGGANRVGFVAKCVDCHLPHDNMAHYLFAKTKAGIRDVGIEFLGDPTATDWHEIRKHREDFVYDSGCLKCHTNLQKATEGNMKSLLPHRDYFSGRTDKKCVSCHEHVGHKHLGIYLDDPKYK